MSTHAGVMQILYSSIRVYIPRQLGVFVPEEWHIFVLEFIAQAIISNMLHMCCSFPVCYNC